MSICNRHREDAKIIFFSKERTTATEERPSEQTVITTSYSGLTWHLHPREQHLFRGNIKIDLVSSYIGTWRNDNWNSRIDLAEIYFKPITTELFPPRSLSYRENVGK